MKICYIGKGKEPPDNTCDNPQIQKGKIGQNHRVQPLSYA